MEPLTGLSGPVFFAGEHMTETKKEIDELNEGFVKLKSGNVSVDGLEFTAVKGVITVPTSIAQFLITEHQAEPV